MLRRLTLGLGAFAAIAFLALPFSGILISAVGASAVAATMILLVVALTVSQVSCPRCGEPFFASSSSRHRLLTAQLPVTNRCKHCSASIVDSGAATKVRDHDEGTDKPG